MGQSSSLRRGYRKLHLLRGTGGLSAEIERLRTHVDRAFASLEEATSLPQIHTFSMVTAADTTVSSFGKAGSVPAWTIAMEGIGDTADTIAVITGTSLDAGIGYDTVTFGSGDETIRITALAPGIQKLKASLTSAGNETISSSTDAYGYTVINFNFNATVSTPSSIRTALQAETVIGRLVSIDFDGNDGTADALEAVDAQTATALTGGHTRKGAAPIVKLDGVTGTLLAGVTASAYADVATSADEQPSATSLKVFFDVDNAAWDALLAAMGGFPQGHFFNLEVIVDGFRLTKVVPLIDLL